MNEPLFRVSVESSSTNEVYWQTEWTDRDDALDIHTDALERISEADDDTIVRWHKKQD